MKREVLNILLATSAVVLISSLIISMHVKTLSSKNLTKSKPKTEVVKAIPTVKNLTKDEYCSEKATIENKSYDEVNKEVNTSDTMLDLKTSQLTATTPGIAYQKVLWEDVVVNSNGARYQLTYGFLGKVNYGGGFYGIISVSDPFVKPSGTGNFQWKESYKQVKQLSTGVFQFNAGGAIDGFTEHVTLDKIYSN